MVELVKEPGDELGIRIMSSHREHGVKVLNLIEGSIASKIDKIRQNDRLLSINGVSLINVSQQNAADIIKDAHDLLGFSVAGGMGSILGDIPVFVIHVNENSNAHNAGVKVGDMILRINTQSIQEQSTQSVLALLKNLNADQLTLKVSLVTNFGNHGNLTYKLLFGYHTPQLVLLPAHITICQVMTTAHAPRG
eukprot:sb/3471013/